MLFCAAKENDFSLFASWSLGQSVFLVSNGGEKPSVEWAALFYFYCFHFLLRTFTCLYIGCGGVALLVSFREKSVAALLLQKQSETKWKNRFQPVFRGLLSKGVWGLELVFFFISLKLSFGSLTVTTYYCYLLKEVSYWVSCPSLWPTFGF